jgi:hypothetical protein
MSVKYRGVEVVPVDTWLVNAFHTLMLKDELVHFWHWAEEGSDHDAVPALEPDQNGESGQYRMYPLDTDEGRKIVLYWSAMTVPILDWSARDEHITQYVAYLRVAKADLEEIAPRKTYRTQRKYETQAVMIGKWADLIEHAQRYRNALLGKVLDPESGEYVPRSDGHAFVDDPYNKNGVRHSEPKFSFLQAEEGITQVGDSFYVEDVKVFRVDTPPEEAERLAKWCDRQAELVLAQYRVTGGAKDHDFFLEKRMKSKLNRLVGLAMARKALDVLRYGVNTLKAEFFERMGVFPGKEAERMWVAATRRSYLEHHRKTGEWRPPTSLDDLVRCARKKGLIFEYLLHFAGSSFGHQLSGLFRRVKEECSITFTNPRRFQHQKLLKFLPVKKAQTRQSGEYFYLPKKEAWAHWVAGPKRDLAPAPVAIPRPRQKKTTIGAMSLLDI